MRTVATADALQWGDAQGRAGRPARILHVLDHSLPEQSGYASRSHAILLSLNRLGLDVEAITSPKHGVPGTAVEEIDGIPYRRTPSGSETSGVAGQLRTVLATRRHLKRYLLDRKPALVHAHSPCLNGLSAAALGHPLVYEMRSSWEDAAVSSGTTTEGSLRYRLSRALETSVVRYADAVVVICEGLRRELIGRGVAGEKITVVPNALPDSMFESIPAGQAAELERRFGLQGKRVIGFFGSFFEWEGVDALVRVMPSVLAAVPRAHLLLAGGGREEARLRGLVSHLHVDAAVTFAGRVPAELVPALYGVADVMVYPRIAHRLTEMVTPLKPLEAMARHVPVIASDIGGHRELIRDGSTGFLYQPGDDEALGRKIVEVLQAGAAVEHVQREARRFVERERRWSVVSERYLAVYERLLGSTLRERLVP